MEGEQRERPNERLWRQLLQEYLEVIQLGTERSKIVEVRSRIVEAEHSTTVGAESSRIVEERSRIVEAGNSRIVEQEPGKDVHRWSKC